MSITTDYVVSEATVAPIQVFADLLTLSYTIGSLADSITFELFNAGCEVEQPKDSDTTAINLINEFFDNPSASCDIEFHTERFVSDTGGFITFTEADNTVGTLDFCIRVTSYEETTDDIIAVALRDTDITVPFNNRENTFDLTGMEIVIDQPDTEVDEILDFDVIACQCENYICGTTLVLPNTFLKICLIPFHPNSVTADTTMVSNFDLKLEAGTLGFPNYTISNPVSFGTETWVPDLITSVDTNFTLCEGCVEVQTLLSATFYLQAFEVVVASGNAFLEFIPADLSMSRQNFRDYAMIVGLGGTADEGVGCLASLLGQIRGYF